ncbi:hypothetical protein ACVMB3_005458 [Sinorhizobium meliloti]
MRRNARRGQAIGGGPRAPPGSWSLLRTNTSQHGGKTATEDRGGSSRDVPPLGATGSAGDMAHPRMQHSGSLSWSPPPCAVSEWLAPVTQSELPNASNGRISRGWPANAWTTDCKASMQAATSASPRRNPVRCLAIVQSPFRRCDHPTNRRASETDHCSRSTTVGVGETCAVAANMYITHARGMESIHKSGLRISWLGRKKVKADFPIQRL